MAILAEILVILGKFELRDVLALPALQILGKFEPCDIFASCKYPHRHDPLRFKGSGHGFLGRRKLLVLLLLLPRKLLRILLLVLVVVLLPLLQLVLEKRTLWEPVVLMFPGVLF